MVSAASLVETNDNYSRWHTQPKTEDAWQDQGEFAIIATVLVWIAGVVVGSVLGIVSVLALEPDSPQPGYPPTPTNHSPSTAASSINYSLTTQVSDVNASRPVCFSRQCLRASRRMQRWLNPLADPCRDWSEYVCGRFEGPLTSVRQLLDLEIAALVNKSVLDYATHPPEDVAGTTDARHKVSKLLLACTSLQDVYNDETEDLVDFMTQHKLDIVASASANKSADQVLEMHVELAFAYGLSGLLTVTPGGGPHTLAIDVDSSLEARTSTFAAMFPSDLVAYLQNLAEAVGKDPDEATNALTLHNSVNVAVVSAVIDSQRGSKSARSPITETKASDMKFEGVTPGAFATAVERKTPYSRNAYVESNPVVLPVLEAVWKALSPAEIVSWTAWAFLHEFGSLVNPDALAFFRRRAHYDKCILRVRQIMPVPFAAIALLHDASPDIQADVTALTKAITECFVANASHWLRRPFPSSPTVVVGFPPGRDTVDGLNAYYAAYPDITPQPFFRNWISTADARRRTLSANETHFDPAGSDIVVTSHGQVLIPAGVFKTILYVTGGLEALNVGGLGHSIARHILRRFLREDVRPGAECTAPAGSDVADDFESLLAFECSRSALPREGAVRGPWLPMLSSLSPMRQFFVLGCYKDCRRRGRGLFGSCDTGTIRRLSSFDDAFGCEKTLPYCMLP